MIGPVGAITFTLGVLELIVFLVLTVPLPKGWKKRILKFA